MSEGHRAHWRAAWRAAERDLAARLELAFQGALSWCDAEPALLRHRSAPGRWTPQEVLEHLTLAHRFLSILIDKIARRCERRLADGVPSPAHPPALVAIEDIARRDFAWPHPAHMAPGAGGNLPTPAVLRGLLEAQRERLLSTLAALPDGRGTLHRIRMSVVPAEDDRLDLGQFLLVVALHLERHLGQMERVKADWKGRKRP